DDRLTPVGNAKPDRGTGLGARLAAVAGAPMGLLPRPDVGGRRRVVVGAALLQELVKTLRVPLPPLELAHRPLVPVELEPPQRVEDLLDVLGGGTLPVGVLDPKHQGAARAAGEEPVVERGSGAADVKRPGRRRGEA